MRLIVSSGPSSFPTILRISVWINLSPGSPAAYVQQAQTPLDDLEVKSVAIVGTPIRLSNSGYMSERNLRTLVCLSINVSISVYFDAPGLISMHGSNNHDFIRHCCIRIASQSGSNLISVGGFKSKYTRAHLPAGVFDQL